MSIDRRGKANQERHASSRPNRRISVTRLSLATRIIARTMLGVFALVMFLISVVAVLGGGFGAKRVGLSGTLHSSAPLIMAHRGVRQDHPGNSRGAFTAALEQGFDAVEIDVKRSADGHYYLFHDRESMQLLGVDIDLSKQRLDELQRYPLHHNGQPTAQRILSLDAFVNEFGDDFIIYLDIKRHGVNNLQLITSDIASFIKRNKLEQRAIIGGDFVFTTWFEYRFPELYTSIGGPGDFRARTYRWIPKRFRPDFMIARASEVTPGLVNWLRQSGLIDRWIIYGVNTDNRELVELWGFSKLLID